MKRLEKLVNGYGETKEKYDELKKDVDEYSRRIKALMKADELLQVVTDKYKVNYQVRKSESLDEDKVIQILKDNGVKGVIKKKEYIDEEALETAIYEGKIDASILKSINDCKIVKETVALTIKGV